MKLCFLQSASVFSKSDLKDAESGVGKAKGNVASAERMELSAKTGEGLDAFVQKLEKALFPQGESGEEYWITNERECAALRDADRGVERILDLLDKNPAPELLAFEMRQVTAALASIIGEISSEDILQTIFSGFCIGK